MWWARRDGPVWVATPRPAATELEELFDPDLNLIGHSESRVGDVGGFAPPGDIHGVHNTRAEIAISIHVYGTDVTRIDRSARRQ
jgi:hypothetical protein